MAVRGLCCGDCERCPGVREVRPVRETLTLANVTPEFRREAHFVKTVPSGEVMEIVRWIDDATVEVERRKAGDA